MPIVPIPYKYNSTMPLQLQSSITGRTPSILPASVSSGRSHTKTDYTNNTGINIFETFVKKYESNNEFERLRKKIDFYYNNNKLLSSRYKEISNYVDDFENQYKKFISDVRVKRQFVEKASSGAKPRDIKTGRDWAEAIIELIDFFNKMKDSMDSYLKQYTDPKIIEKECEKTNIENCEAEKVCDVEKKWFGLGSPVCIYNKETK